MLFWFSGNLIHGHIYGMNCASILGSVLLFSTGNFFPIFTVLRVELRFRQEGFAKGSNLLSVHCQRSSVIQSTPDRSLKWTEHHSPHSTALSECLNCQYNTALWFVPRFVLLPVKTSSLLAYSQTFSQRKQLVLSKAGSAGDSSIQSFTPMAAIHAASILAQRRTFFRQIVW